MDIFSHIDIRITQTQLCHHWICKRELHHNTWLTTISCNYNTNTWQELHTWQSVAQFSYHCYPICCTNLRELCMMWDDASKTAKEDHFFVVWMDSFEVKIPTTTLFQHIASPKDTIQSSKSNPKTEQVILSCAHKCHFILHQMWYTACTEQVK